MIIHSRRDIHSLNQSAVTALIEDCTRQLLISGLAQCLPQVHEYLHQERLLESDILTLSGRANSKLKSMPQAHAGKEQLYLNNVVEGQRKLDQAEEMNPADQVALIRKQQSQLRNLRKQLKKQEGKPGKSLSTRRACDFCNNQGKSLKECRELGGHCYRCSKDQLVTWPCETCKRRFSQRVLESENQI